MGTRTCEQRLMCSGLVAPRGHARSLHSSIFYDTPSVVYLFGNLFYRWISVYPIQNAYPCLQYHRKPIENRLMDFIESSETEFSQSARNPYLVESRIFHPHDRTLLLVRCARGHGPARHDAPHRPELAGVHDRHGAPAPGDLRPDRPRARALRQAGRGAAAALRGRAGDGQRAGREPLLRFDREPPALLPHPQGRAAESPPGPGWMPG